MVSNGMRETDHSPVRIAYAAAHVVRKKDADAERPIRDQIDWDATIAFRRHLWSLGLGVAEAMDTAQRSLLGWGAASELIERTLGEANATRKNYAWPEVIAGAGTDGLETQTPSLAQIIDEYVRQGAFIQSRGGTVILLATPLMPRLFPREEDYVEVYRRVADQLRPPVFVHWLGEMFAANLRGYFPGDSFTRIMEENAGRIAGVKLSLLDEQREVEIRRRLRANGQIVLTGDDYNYSRLILGEGGRGGAPFIRLGGKDFPTGDFSHALLGIFDAIAPVASRALDHLTRGETEKYSELMDATIPLARLIFEPPTENYKAGVVFLAYLNGHQDHFTMLGGLEKARSRAHYEEIARLAGECGVIADRGEARRRMEAIELLIGPDDAFRRGLDQLLTKNAELYRRLK